LLAEGRAQACAEAVEANLSRAIGHSEESRHLALRHVRPISGQEQPPVALGELSQRPAHVDGEGHVRVGRGRGGLRRRLERLRARRPAQPERLAARDGRQPRLRVLACGSWRGGATP
jgi:hypothetical protein